MSTTPAGKALPTDEPFVCPHCADEHPHEHVDERGLVDAYRGALIRVCTTRAVLAAAAVVGGALLAPGALLGGVAAWALATGLGVLVLGLVQPRSTMTRAVLAGAIATAAALPVLAFVLGRSTDAGWAKAAAAGCGWLAIGLTADLLRDRSLIGTLVAHSRDGEAARAGVVENRPVTPWADLGWSLLTAVLFGLWVFATAAVPLLTLTLVPLQVAIAALSRRFMRSRAA